MSLCQVTPDGPAMQTVGLVRIQPSETRARPHFSCSWLGQWVGVLLLQPYTQPWTWPWTLPIMTTVPRNSGRRTWGRTHPHLCHKGPRMIWNRSLGPAFSLSSLAVENPSCPSVESQVTMLGADAWLIFLYKVQCFLNDLQWEMDLSVTRKLGNNHHHLLSYKYTLWACAHHSRQITIGNPGNSQAGTFFFFDLFYRRESWDLTEVTCHWSMAK